MEISPVQRLTHWWFAPLGERRPWAYTGYLLASAATAVVWLAVAVLVAAASIPLALVVVGIPVVSALLGGLVRLGGVDRNRVRWVGASIEAPSPKGIRDPVRWRALAFFFSAIVVFWVLFALTLAGWGLSVYLITFPLWGWAVDVGPLGLVVSFVVGVVALGVGPRAAQLFGQLGVAYTRSLLGPGRTEEMQGVLRAVAAERRRIERNLHDGVQQHLVAVGIDLSLAADKMESDPAAAAQLLKAAQDKNRATIGELRSIGRGLHPAVLDDRGLDAALSSVVASCPVPVDLQVQPNLSLPIDTAETAYFVVSEAVTNIAKHAKARTGSVFVSDTGDTLHIRVHDDGRGGADAAKGTGLAGMVARIRGAEGRFHLTSPKGGPTEIIVELPYA